MLEFICLLVTLLACLIGTICGMGGGIIIKPVLDATGIMSVSTITFLSGCTVIAMSCFNVSKTLLTKKSVLDISKTSVLAFGATIGGILGKVLFSSVACLFSNPNTAGGIQSVILCIATFATFVYTLKKDKIKTKMINNRTVIFFIGFILGIFGSFLGIGGGPFNVAILYYFFSMNTKQAAQNSLYIILFSQLAGTGKNIIYDGIPDFPILLLIGMIGCSILGSELGRKLNQKLNEKQATLFFEGIMICIIIINIYNTFRFFSQL